MNWLRNVCVCSCSHAFSSSTSLFLKTAVSLQIPTICPPSSVKLYGQSPLVPSSNCFSPLLFVIVGIWFRKTKCCNTTLLKSFSMMQKAKSISYSLVRTAAGYTLAWKKEMRCWERFREPCLCLLPLRGSTAFICDLLLRLMWELSFSSILAVSTEKWTCTWQTRCREAAEGLEAAVFQRPACTSEGGKEGLQHSIGFLLISAWACNCKDWACVVFCSAWTCWFHSLSCLDAFKWWNVNVQLCIGEICCTSINTQPCYNEAFG